MKMLTALAAITVLSSTHAFGATKKIGSTNVVSKLEAFKGQCDTLVTQAENTFLAKDQDARTAYGKGLAAAQESLQRQGKLDAFLLIQAEKKRFDSEKTVLEPSGKAESAEIDRLIGIHKKALATARADQTKSMLALKQRYTVSLGRLIKELMVAKDIEQATKTNEESKRVQTEIAALQSELSIAEQALEDAKDEDSEPMDKRSAISRVPRSLRMGLVLYYSFDRNDGKKVPDKSEKNNNGDVKGAKWVSRGKVGGAMSFDGTEQYVVSLKNVGITGNAARTVSFWIYDTSAYPFAAFSYGGAADNNIFEIVHAAYGDNWAIHLWGASPQGRWVTHVPVSTNRSAWHLHTVTFDATAFRWYVDGVLNDISGPYRLNTQDSALTVGTTSQPSGWGNIGATRGYMKGNLDEVMIFDHALTEREVKQLYDAQK